MNYSLHLGLLPKKTINGKVLEFKELMALATYTDICLSVDKSTDYLKDFDINFMLYFPTSFNEHLYSEWKSIVKNYLTTKNTELKGVLNETEKVLFKYDDYLNDDIIEDIRTSREELFYLNTSPSLHDTLNDDDKFDEYYNVNKDDIDSLLEFLSMTLSSYNIRKFFDQTVFFSERRIRNEEDPVIESLNEFSKLLRDIKESADFENNYLYVRVFKKI